MLRAVKVPAGAWLLAKEVGRHLLRRPVVGVAAVARTRKGEWLLIRRADTGQWALPGGTLEWGETLREGIVRELREEAGVDVTELGELVGVYSRPDRDRRFHAVTCVVRALVTEPRPLRANPLEVTEVRLFATDDLPGELSHGMSEMLRDAQAERRVWE